MSTQRTAVKLLLAAVIVEGLVTAYALLNRDPVIVTREIRVARKLFNCFSRVAQAAGRTL
jgi:hypothetical protein